MARRKRSVRMEGLTVTTSPRDRSAFQPKPNEHDVPTVYLGHAVLAEIDREWGRLLAAG